MSEARPPILLGALTLGVIGVIMRDAPVVVVALAMFCLGWSMHKALDELEKKLDQLKNEKE